jgi:hypothetical protein
MTTLKHIVFMQEYATDKHKHAYIYDYKKSNVHLSIGNDHCGIHLDPRERNTFWRERVLGTCMNNCMILNPCMHARKCVCMCVVKSVLTEWEDVYDFRSHVCMLAGL